MIIDALKKHNNPVDIWAEQGYLMLAGLPYRYSLDQDDVEGMSIAT